MNDRELPGTGSPKLSLGQSRNNSFVANRCTLGHLMFFYEPRLFCKAVHNLSTTYPSLEQNTLHSDKKDQCRMGNTAKMTGLNTGQRWRVHGLRSHKGRVVKICFFVSLLQGRKQANTTPPPPRFMDLYSLLKRLRPLSPSLLLSPVLLTCLWRSYF